MEKAVDRIEKAIKNNEKICIYGDYDADGIASTTLLKRFFRDRGIEVGAYIPNRLLEGYGLNHEAVDKIYVAFAAIAQSTNLLSSWSAFINSKR